MIIAKSNMGADLNGFKFSTYGHNTINVAKDSVGKIDFSLSSKFRMIVFLYSQAGGFTSSNVKGATKIYQSTDTFIGEVTSETVTYTNGTNYSDYVSYAAVIMTTK